MQARNTAGLEAMRLAMDESKREHERTKQEHEDHLRQIDTKLETGAELIGRLAQAQLQMAQEAKQQRQRTTEIDERLNALIDIVDKHIRHNGHTP